MGCREKHTSHVLDHPWSVLVDNGLLRPAAVVAVGEGGPCQADGGEDNTGRAHGFGRTDGFSRVGGFWTEVRLNADDNGRLGRRDGCFGKVGRCDQPLFDRSVLRFAIALFWFGD